MTGVPPPVTAAVKVTDWPYTEGLADGATLVLVAIVDVLVRWKAMLGEASLVSAVTM